jgi:hypothetical protein
MKIRIRLHLTFGWRGLWQIGAGKVVERVAKSMLLSIQAKSGEASVVPA